jgi:hypothetical protein
LIGFLRGFMFYVFGGFRGFFKGLGVVGLLSRVGYQIRVVGGVKRRKILAAWKSGVAGPAGATSV